VTVSIADFWKLLGQSRLLPLQQVQQLAADYSQGKAADPANGKAAAEWLVARQAVTRYQAAILLAGKSGPFFFGDYRINERIEKGRLGGAFRAVHVPTGHGVLLQFLTGPVSKEPALWAAASREILAASQIVSPQVQRIFEPVDLGTFKFVVGEDLRGTSLEERLTTGRLPPAEACRIARLAALGLTQIHDGGRVHADIRPANVLLEAIPNQPGNAKLLVEANRQPLPIDFTQSAEPGSRLAMMADYLAPEMMTPGCGPDPLTDIYALGCTLYAMLAGTPPFAGGSIQEKMSRHASEAIQPLDKLGVPPSLTQVVAYMMAKNPAVRFQSAAILGERISGFVDAAALHIPPPVPLPKLASYEQAIRQKHPAPPPPPKPPPPPAVTPPTVANRPLANSAPTVTNVAVVSRSPLEVAAKARSGYSAAAIIQRKKVQQRRRLIVGLFGTAILVFSAAVGGAVWWRNHKLSAANLAAVAKQDQGDTELPADDAANASHITPASANGATPGVDGGGKSSSPGSGAKGAAKGASGKTEQLVSDDGNTLWASPTAGKPISFRCVPPEGQMFLVVRPAEMLESPEGQRILQALGPKFASERERWEKASGVKFDEIEQLIVSLHNNDAKFPRVSYAVKSKEAFTPEQLVAKWAADMPAEAEEKSQKYYAGAKQAYYISTAPEDERTFAMGDAADIKEVAAIGGAPPQFVRDLERLRRTTDAERHCTLLFFPPFLFNDEGEPLFKDERAKIRQPLGWLLGDNLQAASVSLHCGDVFYLELRMLGSLDKEPYKLADELRTRMNEVPQTIEGYIDGIFPPHYWSKLARRYPLMIGQLHDQMRIGVENDQAIVNSVLPASAGHNLVLGGELLVSSAPGQAAVAGTATPQASASPKSIADALQVKTSYSFQQQSLEFAMRDLAEDVKGNMKGAPFEFAIKILGDDLKIDGITRNQSIRDFKQENQTVADILTALVRKANPITTVKDPAEKDQKLIWVIGPDPENAGKQIILITTRAAATTKKYNLPAPFVAKKT
jgi:eukaryotic-like serine/threonine-protein kinase